MDVFDTILKSDIVNLLDEARDELGTTRAVILIRIMDDGRLHVWAVNLNHYETVGCLQMAMVDVVDEEGDIGGIE